MTSRRPIRSRRLAAASVAVALVLPACTFGVRREDARPQRPRPPAVSVSPPACRTTYAEPDPKRPKVTLTFDVDAGHAVVRGTEKVVFTPDAPVTEVVFRLWPNGPGPARNGGRLEVTRASHPMRFEPAGAADGTPGTLLALALPAQAPAGRAITVDLDFTLTLPRADVDRWGHTDRTAWWGSAHPMLAWVRGAGWAREPAIAMLAETAVSETADYDVTVTAPAGDKVLGPVIAEEPADAGDGRQRWRFRNPHARDVAFAVGPFTTRRLSADGVPIELAVSDELAIGGDVEAIFAPVQANTIQSLASFTQRFGPFPYPSLTVVALRPVESAGVEYPGIVFVGSRRYDLVVPHEVAHEWFYGLVGNHQALDPWLDEAFATYAEALFNDDVEEYISAAGRGGDVGLPMTYWDDDSRQYGPVVYGKGSGALLLAREQAGEALFDALLRCYVATQAHQVATPDDLVTALEVAPRAVEVLREAGALPG